MTQSTAKTNNNNNNDNVKHPIDCVFVVCKCTNDTDTAVIKYSNAMHPRQKLTEFPRRIDLQTHHSGMINIYLSNNLSNNELTRVPADRMHNLFINILNVTNNRIVHLDNDSFRSVKCLQSLILESNRLHYWTTAALLNPVRGTLRELNLRNNHIAHINEHTFRANMKNLVHLDLREN